MTEVKDVIEVRPITDITKLKQNLEYASEVAFGGIMNYEEDKEYPRFRPFVEYTSGSGSKQAWMAEQAVKDLFKAGSDLEKAQTAEKLADLKPYSDEARALEKPGPMEIAYDYILGNRLGEESAQITAGVLEQYKNAFDQKKSDFVNMKTQHYKKTQPTQYQWNELNMFHTGGGDHIRRNQIYVGKI